MQSISHNDSPAVDDSDEGLEADEALLLHRSKQGIKLMPRARRMLAGGIVLALSMVAGAWIIVTLAEAGWRLLP